MSFEDAEDAIIVGTFEKGLLHEATLREDGADADAIREAIRRDLDDVRRDGSVLVAASASSALLTIEGDGRYFTVGHGVRHLVPNGERREFLEPMDDAEFRRWVDTVRRAALEGGRDPDDLRLAGTVCWAPRRRLLVGWEGDRNVEAEFEVARIMIE